MDINKASVSDYTNQQTDYSVDPISLEVINQKCDCWANIKNSPCKHLKIFYKIINKFRKEIGA